jgi:hypothetical protein
LNIKELNNKPKEVPYIPPKKEIDIEKFVGKRVKEMKDFRKELGIEKEWKDADKEYVVAEIELTTARKRFETDQDVGLRTRLVPIADDSQDWRSSISEPILLSKILAAFSVIIDNNPEVILTALQKRYEKTTDLANSLWERSWQITNSKEELKKFVLNLAKYGWGTGRSYPRKIEYDKDVLIELDPVDPEKNKYETRKHVWFNDLDRQNLDPYKTWIDEQTQPYDTYSMNDCYYEIDYSRDAAEVEFGKYKNWEYVSGDYLKEGDKGEEKKSKKQGDGSTRKDIITVGFYENRLKDLFVIRIPKKKLVLYYSPLPNDDGMLSIWHSLWILRHAQSPYGIGVWKMIKGNKELYDKMNNMTMDQLVISIYKMFFYTGTSALFADNKIVLEPGKGKQIVNGDIKWSDIPGPGSEAWEGLKFLHDKIDDNSGIPAVVEGDSQGAKTLGELLQQKESALKKMKIPLENISWAIEQDAYLSLSWMAQMYSTPDIKEFESIQKLKDYEQENQVNHDELFKAKEGDGFQATFLPEISLHLEGKQGVLKESKKSKFFQIGKDIKTASLRWRGIVKVLPKSILSPSELVLQQTKRELFNLVVPLLDKDPQLVLKPIKQLIRISEEDEEDWLPDAWLKAEKQANSLFMQSSQQSQQPQPGQPQPPGAPQPGPGAGAQPTPAPQVEGPQQVVPQQQVNVGPTPANIMNRATSLTSRGR